MTKQLSLIILVFIIIIIIITIQLLTISLNSFIISKQCVLKYTYINAILWAHVSGSQHIIRINLVFETNILDTMQTVVLKHCIQRFHVYRVRHINCPYIIKDTNR